MFPPGYRPFVDPVDLFTGWGWGVFLPPLLFAATLVYHALRCEGELVLARACRQAAWTTFKILLFFAAVALFLWLT
jgi:hypothetical protein